MPSATMKLLTSIGFPLNLEIVLLACALCIGNVQPCAANSAQVLGRASEGIDRRGHERGEAGTYGLSVVNVGHEGASRTARRAHGGGRGQTSTDVRLYVFNVFSRNTHLNVSLSPSANAPQTLLASDIPYAHSRLVHVDSLSVFDSFHAAISRRRNKPKPGRAFKRVGSVFRNLSEAYNDLPKKLDMLLIVEKAINRKVTITPIPVDREKTRPTHAFLYFYTSLETAIARDLDVLAYSPEQCRRNSYCIVRIARNMSNHQGITMEIPVGGEYQDYEFKVVEHSSVMTLTDFKNVKSLLHKRVALRLLRGSRNIMVLDGVKESGTIRPFLMAYPNFTENALAEYAPTNFIMFNSYPSQAKMLVNLTPTHTTLERTSRQLMAEYGQVTKLSRTVARGEIFALQLNKVHAPITRFRINQDIPFSNGQCLWVAQSERNGKLGSFLACYPVQGLKSRNPAHSLVVIQHSLHTSERWPSSALNVAFQEPYNSIDRKQHYYLVTSRLQHGDGMRAFIKPGFFKVKVMPIGLSVANHAIMQSITKETCVRIRRNTTYFGIAHGVANSSSGQYPPRFTLLTGDGQVANVDMSFCRARRHHDLPARNPILYSTAAAWSGGGEVITFDATHNSSSSPQAGRHGGRHLLIVCLAMALAALVASPA